MPDPSKTLTICTSSAEATTEVGYRIGAAARPGQIFALNGPLGAGKTQFVKGIARGMGIELPVTSPTFVLVNEYAGDRTRLIHIDTYRLGPDVSSSAPSIMHDAATFGLEEILADAEPQSAGDVGFVVAIEWAERIRGLLPPDHLQISFIPRPDQPECRCIELVAHGQRSLDLLERLND